MFCKNFPTAFTTKCSSLEIQLIQLRIRLIQTLYTASTDAATANTDLYTASTDVATTVLLLRIFKYEKTVNCFAFCKKNHTFTAC